MSSARFFGNHDDITHIPILWFHTHYLSQSHPYVCIGPLMAEIWNQHYLEGCSKPNWTDGPLLARLPGFYNDSR